MKRALVRRGDRSGTQGKGRPGPPAEFAVYQLAAAEQLGNRPPAVTGWHWFAARTPANQCQPRQQTPATCRQTDPRSLSR